MATSVPVRRACVAQRPIPPPSPADHDFAGPKPTIVLVHGAFTDASSWHGVIANLRHAGYPVVAPPNPLRDLAEDSAYVADTRTARWTSTSTRPSSATSSPRTSRVASITQRPITATANNSPSGEPAWRRLPSWFRIPTDDHALHPAAQTDMANRAHAKQAIRISGGHALPVSHPTETAQLIRKAASRTHQR